uniref:Ribosomal protein S4 n=1 Tax=Sciadococcus taiwanensis TaxID=3028030 RepID=A0A9Y1MWY4_9RHOD|nr:ribosomal protein S4 [Sciadococcus taiwanensis]
MSRYHGPKLRITRRLGELPGLTKKTSKKSYPPGQHGQQNKKLSEYALRLQEKQKLKYNYGVSERQLLRYVKEARRIKGSTGLVLLQLLEMRLDNIVFRLKMAPTIPSARQLVNHGHIQVNGKIVTIGSFQCKRGDIINPKNQLNTYKLIQNNLTFPGLTNLPNHLEFDTNKLEGKVNGNIEREWIAINLNELLVVEYYSRKV